MKNYLKLALVLSTTSLIWADYTPQAAADAREELQDAIASISPSAIYQYRIPQVGNARSISTDASGSQDFLQIDPAKVQSLAKAACLVNSKSDLGAPFASEWHLDPGPYPKAYPAQNYSKVFSIVGNECDYLNRTGISIQMVIAHQTKDGIPYVALFSTKGDVQGILRDKGVGEPLASRYINLFEKGQIRNGHEREVQSVDPDLKLEVDFWNNGLNKILQSQRLQPQEPVQTASNTP